MGLELLLRNRIRGRLVICVFWLGILLGLLRSDVEQWAKFDSKLAEKVKQVVRRRQDTH